MTEKDVVHLLKTIQGYYTHRFKLEKDTLTDKVKTWHRALQQYELEEVLQKLSDFVLENPFPPTISDLIPKKSISEKAVPNAEETRQYLQQQDSMTRASENVAEANLAKIRAMLNIQRGNQA